jgi:glycerol-3-phosphate dehydrogenase
VKKLALKSAPGVDFGKGIRNFAGLRAVSNQEDFILGESPEVRGFFNVAGIKSPGLTAAPAIALHMAGLLAAAGLPLREKPSYDDTRHVFRLAHLDEAAKAGAIAKNPLYGRVVCRCETITEGEVVDALRRPLPPRSLDAVKRRVGPGMGRCQGGFCGPRVQAIIARELGLRQSQVPQDRAGMDIVIGQTKEPLALAAGVAPMAAASPAAAPPRGGKGGGTHG